MVACVLAELWPRITYANDDYYTYSSVKDAISFVENSVHYRLKRADRSTMVKEFK